MHPKIVRRGEYGIHPDRFREETTDDIISSISPSLMAEGEPSSCNSSREVNWLLLLFQKD